MEAPGKELPALSLANQNICITGVSRSGGIGAAIAKRCLRAGAAIAVHGNSGYDEELQYPDAHTSAVEDIKREMVDGEISMYVLPQSDLAQAGQAKRAVDLAKTELGTLSGLVINHAYSVDRKWDAWTEEHIDRHLTVNVRATMMLIQAFSEQVDQKLGGVITLFTSGQYLGPMVNEIAYAVSKDAVCSLTKQTAVALADRHIRVNCINPGPTDTGYMSGEAYAQVAKLFPQGRWGLPDDAAKLVQFLHSEHAQWITGQIIASEGGFYRYRS